MRKSMDEHIQTLFADVLSTVRAKNADYAGDADPWANFRISELLGVPVERAILVRVSDKLSRISNLLDKDAQVMDERREDTIKDAIGYLAILHAYLSKEV